MKNGIDSAVSKNFLSPKEGADLIGVTVRTFYKYLQKPPAKGGPPVKRFGRNIIRLPRKQFLSWAGIEES